MSLQWEIKSFEALTVHELYDILRLRSEIFVVEQNCVYLDLDGKDKKALHLFVAPERAKYYFTPEVDKKIRAADSQSVAVREGMELLIMSRMKREVPLTYCGPAGVIYAVYFTYNENIDAGAPLIGVCPQDQLPAIQEVIMRVQTEWTEKD